MSSLCECVHGNVGPLRLTLQFSILTEGALSLNARRSLRRGVKRGMTFDALSGPIIFENGVVHSTGSLQDHFNHFEASTVSYPILFQPVDRIMFPSHPTTIADHRIQISVTMSTTSQQGQKSTHGSSRVYHHLLRQVHPVTRTRRCICCTTDIHSIFTEILFTCKSHLYLYSQICFRTLSTVVTHGLPESALPCVPA